MGQGLRSINTSEMVHHKCRCCGLGARKKSVIMYDLQHHSEEVTEVLHESDAAFHRGAERDLVHY